LKNIEELDGILKRGMEGFSSAAPDVWDAISQQVQVVTPQASAPTQTIWQAIQQASVLFKSAVFIGISVVTSLTVHYYWPAENSAKNNMQAVVSTVHATEQAVTENKVESEQLKLVQPELLKREKHKPNINLLVNEEANRQVEPINHTPIISAEQVTNKETKLALNESEKAIPVIDKIPLTENFDSDDMAEPNAENAYYDKPHFGNVFSPNGDGKNDTWEIIMDAPKYFHLRIFDRGGKLVYETENVAQAWPGTYGKSVLNCDDGVYAFQLEYQYSNQNKVQIIRGMVTLIR
jgi:gliding motility-associated-like protein